jgi:hypothetical protein
MKKVMLCIALFLLPFANLWCQVNFTIETDTTIYYQNQPIEISFIIHNGTDDTLHLIFFEVPPFFYYIDGVLYDPPAWQVVIDVFIPPDSSHITSIIHDQPISLGVHSIIGGFPYQPPNNNWFTDPVEITVIENIGLEDNTVDLNYSQLYQNYPNPFGPSTVISFSLTQNIQKADLKIYNIRGQLVRELDINNKFVIGSISWDGRESNGKQVGSGIYFYKLTSDKKEIVKKLVLMR